MQKSQTYLQLLILIITFYLKIILCQKDLNSVLKSFVVEEVKVQQSPFCIIRHYNISVWDDYYISYDKKIQLMKIQKNNDEPQYISNFHSNEKFVLCYLSTIVENQITIISLNNNFTQPGINLPIQGNIFSFLGGDTPWSVQTEYQYNLTSGIMKNAGYPRRATNDSNYFIEFSTQYGIFDKSNDNEIDYKQFGLSPTPNYDEPYFIYYNQTTKSASIPHGFFFQYSNAYSQYYVQEFLSTGGAFGTLFPTINDQYSIITASTINVTSNTKTISISRHLQGSNYLRVIGYDKEICTLFNFDIIQEFNDQYLMITHKENTFIIEREEFFNFYETKQNKEDINITYCYFQNYTRNDQYYYELGQFNIHPKDWLGVIELQLEENGAIEYILTASVFDSDNSTLKNYTFYSIDLEKKTKPIKLDTKFDYNSIQGYFFYEGFTYYRGKPIKLNFNSLNRFALLYLVKDKSILKLQFNLAENIGGENGFSYQVAIFIFNTILISFNIVMFQNYHGLRKNIRLTKEQIKKFKKVNYYCQLKDGNKDLVISLMKSINNIYVLDEDFIVNWQVIQDNQIVLPNYNLMKMETNEFNFYCVNLDKNIYSIAWKFIQQLKMDTEVNSNSFSENEDYYKNKKNIDNKIKYNELDNIFSSIKYALEISTEQDYNIMHQFLFVVENNSNSLYNLKNFRNMHQPQYISCQKLPGEVCKNCMNCKDGRNCQDCNEDYEDRMIEKEVFQPELIIMRKFTQSLKYLKQQKLIFNNINILQNDICDIIKADISINPLIFFFSLQQSYINNKNINQNTTLDILDEKYLELSETYIKYLNNYQSANIQCISFNNFKDCIEYFSFHIDMKEYLSRFEEQKSFLGKGSYGVVKQIKDKLTNNILAVKIQTMIDTKSARIAQRELNTLKNLSLKRNNSNKNNNSCVTKFYFGVIDTSIQNNAILFNRSYIIMEKAEKCLKQEIIQRQKNINDKNENEQQPFTNQQLMKMFYELCSNLLIIHRDYQYIHGDISLDNILKISENVYKLSDFGSANEVKLLNYSSTNIFSCKPLYLNPEMIQKQQLLQTGQINIFSIMQNFGLRQRNDYYALGLVFYQAVTLNTLFQPLFTYEACQNNIKQMKKQLQQYQNQYSIALINGIQSLLNSKPLNIILKEFMNSYNQDDYEQDF